MHLTHKEIWTALHGMLFGAGFLVAFAGVFAAVWTYRADWLSTEGLSRRRCGMVAGSWFLVVMAWIAVLAGTYIVYPWYRARGPANADHPKYLLVASDQTKQWHEFGMEWKEHIAWLTPILATAVAVIVTRHSKQLLHEPALRRAVLMLLIVAFFAAAVAAGMGAFINKMAPTR